MGISRKVKISELAVGMMLDGDVVCAVPSCPAHGGKTIGGLKAGKKLTREDILLMQKSIACLTSKQTKKFKSQGELEDFIEVAGAVSSRRNNYTVILREQKIGVLRSLGINDLKKYPREHLGGIYESITVLAEPEPTVGVVFPDEKTFKQRQMSAKDLKDFKKKLKDRMRSIYNEVRNSVDSDMEVSDLPQNLITDTYDCLVNVRQIFENSTDSMIMAELNNDVKDNIYTGLHDHCCLVALTAAKILQSMEKERGWREYLEQVFFACMFLDIGLLFSRKFGKTLNRHPELGAGIYEKFLEKISPTLKEYNPGNLPLFISTKSSEMSLKIGLNVIRSHHERLDGSGYPFGYRDHHGTMEIDRLVAVIDEFYRLVADTDMHSSEAPLLKKTPLTREEAFKCLEDASKFDQRLVAVFKKHIFMYPLHSLVYLSDGRKAVVRKLNPKKESDEHECPIVYTLENSETLDLSQNGIFIAEEIKNKKLIVRKKEVFVDVIYTKRTSSIRFQFDESLGDPRSPKVCPVCSCAVPAPREILDPFSIGDCLNDRTAVVECENRHLCIFTVEPPEDCDLLECQAGVNCPKDFKLFIESFTDF